MTQFRKNNIYVIYLFIYFLKKLYDKTDDFNFLIVNFPFICSNFPAAPA